MPQYTESGPRGTVKIVRVITRLNIGGPAIHAILLSGELNKRGYKDVLVVGRPGPEEGEMSYLAERSGVKPIVIPEMARELVFWNDLKSLFKISAIIRRERPDIVHTHTAKAGSLGRLAAVFAGVPVKIHTFHGHVFDGYFGSLRSRVFILIERFLGLFTDKVIVVSDKIRHELVDKLKVVDGNKCVVMRLGFELDRFLTCDDLRGLSRGRIGLGTDELAVGIVGRLVPIKNHKLFLDACRMVEGETPRIKVKFIVIGDGELKEELIAYAEKIGLKNVLFTGWIRDLPGLYAGLDVVALTSINEGTPVSLIEAMASAKPVLSTDVGGVGDIISDNETGLLARSGDVAGFSRRLSDLLKDSGLRARLGSNGRQFVKDRFTKDRLLKDIEELYADCLKRHIRK